MPLVDLAGMIEEEEEPITPLTEEEKRLQDFFNEAEYFEIEFYFYKNLVGIFGDPYQRVQIVETAREIKANNGTYIDFAEKLREIGVIDNSIKFKAFELSAELMLYDEYIRYSNGTSFDEMQSQSYEQWSQSTKLFMNIWAFGLTQEYLEYCRTWHKMEPEYVIADPEEEMVESLVNGQTTDANKLKHIFGQERHKLKGLLDSFSGNQMNAYSAVEQAAQEYATMNNLTSVLNEFSVVVSGYEITVRGIVIDGILKIGTFFIK